jgi:predicted DsbA family dithiol-disulfide isomerase
VVRLRVYYDLVCPYSYLESHVREAAEDAGEAEVEWLPFELRPAPKALLDPRGEHLRTDWPRNVYPRAFAAGVEIHLPPVQPRSTLPLAACLAAGEAGVLRLLRRALYAAFFCEGEDVSAEPVIRRAAEAAGWDDDAAIVAAYAPARIERLHAIRREAIRAGVRGVPSILTEDGRTHWGQGGLERLRRGDPLVPRRV